MGFFESLRQRAESLDSWVCVGLDPVRERLPHHLQEAKTGMDDFLTSIVEATLDVACCYKPNLAFYLAEGSEGIRTLECLREAIPTDVPVILDAKVGDIGSTAAAYAKAAFDVWGFDAITVNPYVGDEAVLPFTRYADRGVFVLVRTSNPHAPRFQGHHDLWNTVLQAAMEWNSAGNTGVVVGATYPEELVQVRRAAPNLPFLVPGIGAQGGDLAATTRFGPTKDNIPPVVNSSRGIIFASEGRDFAEAARQAATSLRDQIREARETVNE